MVRFTNKGAAFRRGASAAGETAERKTEGGIGEGAVELIKKVVEPAAPQKNLVPIEGTPFMITEDKPIDPRDCDNFPNSIWCEGYSPSATPFEINFDIVRGECDVGVQAQGGVFGLPTPPFQITYRKPGCRPTEETFPPPELPDDAEGFSPPDFPLGISNTTLVVCVLGLPYDTGSIENQPDGKVRQGRYRGRAGLTSVTYPGRMKLLYDGVNSVSLADTFATFNLSGFFQRARDNDLPNEDYTLTGDIPPFGVPYNRTTTDGTATAFNYGGSGVWRYPLILTLVGQYGTVKAVARDSVSNDVRTYPDSVYWDNFGCEILYLKPLNELNTRLPFTAAPPVPPNKKDCCMSCCSSQSNQDNDDLLREILRRLKELSKIVGVDQFPVKTPKDISQKKLGSKSVDTIAGLINNIVYQLDAVSGDYPLEIEIKDTDLTKKGNQTKTLSFPNQSELLAELFGLVFQAQANSDLAINTSMRNLAETGAIRNQSIQTYFLNMAIAEYLGFDMQQRKEKVPMAFNPVGTSIEDILKEGQVEIPVFENRGKRDLQDSFTKLLFAASIIKAAFFKKYDANKDFKEQLKDWLGVTDDELEEELDNFDEFLEQSELGFRTATGLDPKLVENPYGRDYDRRPRIIELNENQQTD